jgi:adenylosuccinate lyase
VDAVLNIYLNVSGDMVVYENVIKKRINEELPFMATETILMTAVSRGGDRQQLHEKIREYSMQASYRVKAEGKDNNLIELISADPAFLMTREEIDDLLSPENFIGMAPMQTSEFLQNDVKPVLDKHKNDLVLKGEVDL